MHYIRNFNLLSMKDIPLVGGKNAALGEMITHLCKDNTIVIPQGFAITTQAYQEFLRFNKIETSIQDLLKTIPENQDFTQIARIGSTIRALIKKGTFPEDLLKEIKQSYTELSLFYNTTECDVAVRSSATAEDLPGASFAGQQDSYLNIHGIDSLTQAIKNCMASLFNDRALVYRHAQHFDHAKVALSVGVQKMARSDKGCSGVSFSLDPETGFKDVVVIDASYGLGETLVQGLVTPDSYTVHKPTALKGFQSIIQKKKGAKDKKLIYSTQGTSSTVSVAVEYQDQQSFALQDHEIMNLAHMVIAIETYYSQLNGHWTPMDIEWAKDGIDNNLYIVQARPETVHSARIHNQQLITTYTLKKDKEQNLSALLLATGQSIGHTIVTGTARLVKDIQSITTINPTDIIVTEMTDPDWVPVMKKAAAIITKKGGRTCHAAIVSRELGIPAVVGIQEGITTIVEGQELTIDCSQGNVGFIYKGKIEYELTQSSVNDTKNVPVSLMVNIANPDAAYTIAQLPVDGVGLARLEFIIANLLKVHPMALLFFEKVTDPFIQEAIEQITAGYQHKKDFFIEVVSQAVGMIAASFYPRPVTVRLSDFKTNEYRNLIGGSYFEPQEENPMLGLRGAARYCHEFYKDSFDLECQALQKVVSTMGLDTIKIMVPFVRTIKEATQVKNALKKYDFKKHDGSPIDIIMMCEIPSNVLLIDEFSSVFDGFSIGSNDLTQLVLGVDRESALLTTMFDERDPAIKKILAQAIEGALRNKKPIGICGQAPSDFPEIADFLIAHGITSLSLNPDCVLDFIKRYTHGA